MYKPPFHRRILPWIFTIAFLVSAPALVFYTSGYRWNPKKEKIERNGTLIIDSTPDNARILLNGHDSGETTPVTMQNVTPGHYDIRVEQDGYSTWEKQLDVYPEYVTFANTIKLWKLTSANRIRSSIFSTIQASPNGSFLATLSASTSTPSSLDVTDPDADATVRTHRTFPYALSAASHILWSPDSRALLVTSPTGTGEETWFVNTRTESAPTLLPMGTYRWDGSTVRGIAGQSQIAMNESDGSFTRTELTNRIHDRYGDLVLRETTGTADLVLFLVEDPARGLILPPGEWHFMTITGNTVILRDGNEWISLDPDNDSPSVHRVYGDRLRPFVTRGKTTYLLVNGGELWSWDPSSDPELLLRQSQPIKDAAWNETGRAVIFAIDGTIVALDLDPRDGRLQTTLFTATRTDGFALTKKKLFVIGEQSPESGMWVTDVE